MGAAEDFRFVAQRLGSVARDEVERLDGGDAAEYLTDIAHAGKAAADAAKALEPDESDLARVSRELGEQLREAGVQQALASGDPKAAIGALVTELKTLRQLKTQVVAREDVLIGAYQRVAQRLSEVTERAQQSENPAARRAAARNREAITHAIIELERINVTVPLFPTTQDHNDPGHNRPT